MKFNNLAELAKAVSLDILTTEFRINKKYPINKDLLLDVSKLPDDDNGDLARTDPDEFIRMVNIAIDHKLKYMYEEGFLEKKKHYYYALTREDINNRLKELEESDD